MASGDKGNRMVFDIRGRRKNVVKVVYAILAVLMGASLFVAVGPFNLGELFNSASVGDASEPFEEQAERIEVKLKKDPDDPNLLVALARDRVNAGNAQITVEPNGEQLMTLDTLEQFQQASDAWSDYLSVSDEPSAGVAQLMAPTLLRLAELSRSYGEAEANIRAAREAQEIVAKARPTLNSLSTLATYTYFAGDFAAAEKARNEAEKLTKEKFERDSLDTQLDEVEKRARKYHQEAKKAKEEQGKPADGGGAGAGPESLESGESPLSGTFGGGGQLTE
jgi:hypothetical protein